MKITLRKASVLQNDIQAAIKAIEFTGRISINEFQEPKSALATANTELKGKLSKVSVLSVALSFIRASVGVANVEAGVHSRLAELAVIDKMIARYTDFLMDTNKTEDIQVIEGRVAKLSKKTDSNAYYGSDAVETGILSESDFETFSEELRQMRKRKQAINDAILELNIRTEIEINENITHILQSEKII